MEVLLRRFPVGLNCDRITMSLDISICDENGLATASSPLGVDEHWKLMELANERSLMLCLRMQDYYEDVEFAPAEVGPLLNEITVARLGCNDVSLGQQLDAIVRLLIQGIENKQSVNVIAD